MSNTEGQIFLAIATKNNLLSREQAAACKKEAADRGMGVPELVLEKELLPLDKIKMLLAAVQQVQSGNKGTVRIQTQATPPKPTAPANPNEPIPGYAIKGKLGVGGQSTVFLAEDKKNKRDVALKIMKPALAKDPKAMQNFLREAELLCQFEHPNIVRGYDFGSMGPLNYMVIEYMDGPSVFDIIEKEKSLSEARSLEVILEAGKALSYMKQKGIVHRDIKPDNLMSTTTGRIVLCDLGFAIPISGEDTSMLEEETTSGTVQYMSPEQAKGGAVDIRADIYSLGATLYHMIMGEVPFSGDDSHDVMAKQVLEALNSSEIKNRRISRHMHYFIERMMSKDKDLRYATPEELVDDINEQIEGFRSLEYRPEEDTKGSRVLGDLGDSDPGRVTKKTKIVRRDEGTKRRTARIDRSKLRERTSRFRKR